MIFGTSFNQDEWLENVLTEAISELQKFFEFRWTRNKPRLFLVPNRQTINQLFGAKTPPSVVGWSEMRNIFLLAPQNYEAESNHRFSTSEYTALIKHEVCHSFYGVITGSQYPKWLSEGVAIYTSGQIKLWPRPLKIEKLLEFYEAGIGGPHAEAGFVVEALIFKFGKGKLLRLIKYLAKIPKNRTDFDQLFQEIYGEKPGYDFFGRICG